MVRIFADVVKIVVLTTRTNAACVLDQRGNMKPRNSTYHFCVLVARFNLAMSLLGSTVPRKIGLN